MKYILVMATGVLFGELIDESVNIFDSIMFTEQDSLTDENLKTFLANQNDRIKMILPDLNEEIISDNPTIVETLRGQDYASVRFANAGELHPFRSIIGDYLVGQSSLSSPPDLISVMRKKALAHTQALLREKIEVRDKYIAQAINSIDDINSILNLIYARLSEWFGIHFPELQELVRDNNQYIRLISNMKGKVRSEISVKDIESLSERRQDLITEAAKNSLGADISVYDMSPITQLASFGVEILKIKDNLENYIDESMQEVAPNLKYLVGSLLGARLISLAGNLENLAKRSSGTIQVLGAEKALFRHLRSGEDPPKHGVIFQSPFIHSARKHQRGKISRALAGKLSIAARVDFFSGEFIGQSLLEDLEKRIESVKNDFPEPSELQITRKKQKKKFKSGKKRGRYGKRSSRRKEKQDSDRRGKRKKKSRNQ
ncbi:MAG: NOP5/NOP56 family protein [Candidatus Hodarchaeales archaeon]